MEYIPKLREKIGHDKFIHPGARIIIENEKGEILFIERTDNGNIGLPAGGLEENETIEECIRREVLEETGLTLLHLTVIGISTQPNRETVYYPNKDVVQYFNIEFYSNSYEGEISIQDTKEIKTAKFLPFEKYQELPPNERNTFKSLAHYKKYQSVCLG